MVVASATSWGRLLREVLLFQLFRSPLSFPFKFDIVLLSVALDYATNILKITLGAIIFIRASYERVALLQPLDFANIFCRARSAVIRPFELNTRVPMIDT